MRLIVVLSALFVLSIQCVPICRADQPAVAAHGLAAGLFSDSDADLNTPDAEIISGPSGEVARFRMAYDAVGLLIRMRVHEANALRNSASAGDPAMILKGGDAIGFTFGRAAGAGTQQRIILARIDGKPMAVVYRPQSAEKHSYTFRSPVGAVTLDYVAVAPEISCVFKASAAGYVADVVIPWSVLGYTPSDGLKFPFDAQVILADTAGQKNAESYWWHSVGSGPSATVDLPTEAQLYPDLWGTAVLSAAPPAVASQPAASIEDHAAGSVPIHFHLPRDARVSLNITNDSGWIYRELLAARPMTAGDHTAYWDGRDEYGDPLPPGRYHWKLGYFQSVWTKRIGGAGNSAHPPYRTPNGHGDLGAVHGLPVAVASDAGGIYHLGGCEEGNPGLTKLDIAGNCLWKHTLGGFGVGRAIASDGTYAWLVSSASGATNLIKIDAATGKDVPITKSAPRVWLGDGKLDVTGLAIVGGKAWYALPSEQQIDSVDLASGEIQAPISIPNARYTARLDETDLLLCASDRVMAYNVATGASRILVHGLDDAHSAAVDPSGNIYVSEWGARQRISKFSPNGQRMASFGRLGGRPATCSPYDPTSVYNVESLTIGPDDNIWFMEFSNLRRAGVFTTSGKWVKDLFETLPSQGGAGVDLDDMSRVFYHPGYQSIIAQSKIDFAAAAKTPTLPDTYWKPEAIYNMTMTGTYDSLPGDITVPSTSTVDMAPIAFTGANGKRYVWVEGIGASLWLPRDGRLVPISVMGDKKMSDGKLETAGSAFAWSDTNGDGKVEADEVRPFAGDTSWRWIGRDLTLYGNHTSSAGTVFGTLKPYRIDPAGAPYYRESDFKPYITSGHDPRYYFRFGSYGIQDSAPAPDGAQYFVFNSGFGQQHAFWDRSTYSRIARAKNGRIQWIAGQHGGERLHDADATFLWRPLGEVDDTLVVGDVDFQLLAYTSDGLALGPITPRGRVDDFSNAIVQENVQSGIFARDPITHKPLIVIGSGTEAVALEVTGIGPGTVTRMSGDIDLASASPRSPQEPGQYAVVYRTWPNTHYGRFAWLTGDGYGFRKDVPWMEISDKSHIVADVRIRRDAGFLCIYASILDSTPLTAPKPANPADLFGKADGLELLLGPSGENGSHRTGETRIFLTGTRNGMGTDGQPLFNTYALAYQPGGTGATAASLAPIPGAKVAVVDSFNNQGYHVEAEIPLSFFPSLTQTRTVTFIRNHQPNATKPGDTNETYTEARPDLVDPFHLDVAVWDGDAAGGPRRISWSAGPTLPVSATDLSPKNWGIASTADPTDAPGRASATK